MNITCEISSTNESNSFKASNNTEVEDFQISLLGNILTILLSFPTNSYVIWLIVTGTGNGLAAEFFTLNLSVCEIFYCIECLMICLSYQFKSLKGVINFLDGIPITGCPLFECLICVERYLAVVHPVTFLKYKPLRYRLMCAAVAWIICFCSCIFVFMLLIFFLIRVYFILYVAQYFIFFSVQLFCCLAVLRALKRSGPGERERAREREEENHMKRRAFYLILITTVTTVILNTPEITLILVGQSSKGPNVLQHVSYIFFLFAGLVQPLMFLNRVGKLNFIKEGMKM